MGRRALPKEQKANRRNQRRRERRAEKKAAAAPHQLEPRHSIDKKVTCTLEVGTQKAAPVPLTPGLSIDKKVTLTMEADTPTPLWLDCDPGHDDAFAILLAAHHPSLKLLGVSTVHGNASVAHTTANAGSILTALGVPDIPYYAGAAKPFCREAVHAPNIHGASGLDGTDLLPKASVPPVKDGNAVLAMRQALMTQPVGKPWLVATGALTNIALLFATFPEAAEHIAGLSIMGGAIGDGFTDAPMGRVRGEGQRFGNHTPWSEFNIYCDPEAAQSIFSNPILASKTTLIPLDITHQVLATKAVQERVLYGSSSLDSSTVRQMFHDLLVYFAHTYADVFGILEGPPLHDPVAVAVVLFDIGVGNLAFDDVGGERYSVDIVTDGMHSDQDRERGQVGRTKILKANGGKVRIPHGLNVGRFWDVIEGCLQQAGHHTGSEKLKRFGLGFCIPQRNE